MTTQLDIERIIHDDRMVAAFVDGDRLFGVFTRTLPVPPGWIAVASLKGGGERMARSGDALDGTDVSGVLLVRATACDVEISTASVSTSDHYLCDVRTRFALRVLGEPAEREAFRKNVMRSHAQLTVDRLAEYVTHPVDQSIRQAAASRTARELIDGDADAAIVAAIEAELKGPCFTGGIVVEGVVRVDVSSDGYEKVRTAQERAARRLGEHQAQRRLQEAIQTAHTDRIEHLETMLTRVSALAEQSPDVELPDLMRAFDQVQRGQLYQALFAAEAGHRVTQWLIVAAGSQLLFFDPAHCGSAARTVAIEGQAGALRSVQWAEVDGRPRLLLGAANGVYVMAPGADKPETVLLFGDSESAAGGVNAVAAHKGRIVATHSKRGVTMWSIRESGPPVALCSDLTRGAPAVRAARFDGDRFYCSVGERIVSLPADDLKSKPTIVTTLTSVISTLATAGGSIYAGTSAGEVVMIPVDEPERQQVIHAGSHRAVESIHVVEQGPVARLFYTDTTLAVFARVIGDTFTCRYEAGGQTLRRAEAAADYLAVTNDARDRVMVFATHSPEQPRAVIPVTQLTGRSVQDTCLVPQISQPA